MKPPRADALFGGDNVQNFVLVVGGFVIVGEEGWQRLVAFAVRRRLVLLDQTRLPAETVYRTIETTDDLVRAIEHVVETATPLIEQKRYLRNFFDKAAG